MKANLLDNEESIKEFIRMKISRLKFMKENINFVNSLETVNNLELGDVDVGYLAREKHFTCKQYIVIVLFPSTERNFPTGPLCVFMASSCHLK